jgi:hypothetical protein
MELPFEPFALFSGSHQQTIIGSFLHMEKEPKSQRLMVTLPDMDSLALEITTPSSWKPTDPTIVMIHGLCGSHRSPYLIRMTKKLSKLGFRCVRLNLRGCGSGKGHAKQLYHAGRSDDVYEALSLLRKQYPESPIVLVGFSLGGNIALKLAGELGSFGEKYLTGVIAVGAPVDLFSSVNLVNQKNNRIYERYFVRLLKSEVAYRHKKYPDLEKIHLPKRLTMFEFDEYYTAPQSGFKNAIDYYRKCSSVIFIPQISVPCTILFSEDDPIVSSKTLDEIKLPENIRVFKTKRGGHLGYLSSPLSKGGFHWMDEVLIRWVQEKIDP